MENPLAAKLLETDSVTLEVYGTPWCQLALEMKRHLENILPEGTGEVLFIDEEENRERCQKERIMVGQPALIVYRGGNRMIFRRFIGDQYQDSFVFYGCLNADEARTLLYMIAESSDSLEEDVISL